MKSILLIGPLENKKDPTKTGGIVVLFNDLLSQFKLRNIDFMVIDTNKANYPNILLALFTIYFKIIVLSFKADHLSLHGTAKDYIFIAPLVVMLSKVQGKTCSLRKFAGDFNKIYNISNILKKRLIEFSLKNSNMNFFETRYLVDFFAPFNTNTFWFPNVRKNQASSDTRVFQKKFVFISQLFASKGVDEILKASNLLPDGYTVDLYGPLHDTYTHTHNYFDDYRANYKSSLKPNQVLSTLEQYDVLLLPTYYPGEGYPGIVIEALSLGKPVIVTDLPSIQEMVDENCAIFVKPKNYEDIMHAILKFNTDNYLSYSQNALSAFKQFDSDIQTDHFIKSLGLEKNRMNN
jgi:glycosyltransferase involved in cell wall biosynthesis